MKKNIPSISDSELEQMKLIREGTKKEFFMIKKKTFLKKLYNGAIDKLIYNFIDQKDLSEEDINKLQEILENTAVI